MQDEVPRNEWRLGMVMETSMYQEALVRAVKVKLGFRNSQKGSVFERPVQKVVFLMEGLD